MLVESHWGAPVARDREDKVPPVPEQRKLRMR